MSHATNDPRTLHVHPLLALVAGLAVVAGHASLDSALSASNERLTGPAVQIGHGTARAYVETDAQGRPAEIGVILTEDAMHGLPEGHEHHESVLQFPQVDGVPFLYVTFGWNPAGHEPPGIYDIAHFDVHFYTLPDAERRGIVPGNAAFGEKGQRHPAPDYMPASYMADPNGAVPLMGTHWIDPETPELNGQRFTETLLFGSWDGRFAFIEPMLTREWLLTRPALDEPIEMPAKVATDGYWPTRWSVRHDAERREYRIALGGLVQRKAE